MEIFCTYCSREKNESLFGLPAIRRYKSNRIRKIYDAAKSAGLPFFILSGKLGLIPSHQKIENYDHLLKPNEVSEMALEVVKEINNKKISRIYYFTNSIEEESNLQPYFDVISIASKNAQIDLNIIEINIPDDSIDKPSGFREVWYRALDANQSMVLSQEKDNKFDELFKEYPDDGMLYYERGEAYESLGKYDDARLDYDSAYLKFPNPKWQKAAFEGLKRIENIIGDVHDLRNLNVTWNYFHAVHSYVHLPHLLRVFILSALERFEEEKRIATAEFRICIEMIVNNLLQDIQNIKPNENEEDESRESYFQDDIFFSVRLNELLDKEILSTELEQPFRDVWRTGCKAIHWDPKVVISDYEYRENLKDFMKILDSVNKNHLLKM